MPAKPKTVSVSIRFAKPLHLAAVKAAHRDERSFNKFVTIAVENAVAESKS